MIPAARLVRMAAAAIFLLFHPALLAQDFAVVGAKTWTMTSQKPVENATIIVRSGKIVSIENSGTVPPDLKVIAGESKVVTPGFFNAATQIGLIETGAIAATDDRASDWDRLGAGFDVSRALNGNSLLVELARADGITGAFVYPSASKKMPFGGLAATVKMRNTVEILDRPAASLVAYLGDGVWKNASGSRAVEWQALRMALEGGSRPSRTGAADKAEMKPDDWALSRVRAREIPLSIFADRESDIREAIKLAKEFDIRIVIIGGAQAWRAAGDLAEAKIPVVVSPALNLPYNYDKLGARLDNAQLLARAGVEIAFGLVGGRISSNYNAGLALREEAGIAVANGLPYFAALRAVTTAPRTIYGVTGGILTEGADADFVIWDGDPIEPSTLALKVYSQGIELPTSTRQDALASRYLEHVDKKERR